MESRIVSAMHCGIEVSRYIAMHCNACVDPRNTLLIRATEVLLLLCLTVCMYVCLSTH